jgi:hypothetical protein
MHGQSAKDNILGDWKEVRREDRAGYLYVSNIADNKPGIEFSFFGDGTGTLFNPATPEKALVKSNYSIIGDSILVFNKIYEIDKLTKDTLILTMKMMQRISFLDQRYYFIRKTAFEKLSAAEIDSLKAPSKKDFNKWNSDK